MQARLPHRALLPVVATLLTLAPNARAQSSFNYVVAESAAPFRSLSGGTRLSFSNTRTGVAVVSIGFPFSFYGVEYSSVNVGLNGVLTFAADCGPSNPCTQGFCNVNSICQESFLTLSPNGGFPSTATPNGWVAPFWDDLVIQGTAEVLAGVEGNAPRREFVIEWRNIQRFPGSQANATFQARLQEGTNVIRMHYGSFSTGAASSPFRGTIGVESPDGRTGLTTRACGRSDSCTRSDLINLSGRVITVILPSGAELAGEGTAPTGGDPGDALPLTLTVRNLGTTTTTVGFDARLYFSTDDTIERSDRELGRVTFPALGPNQSSTRTLTTTVPSLPIGTYAIGALVDTSSVVPEAVETNNVILLRRRFLIGADLSVGVSAPSAGGIGDPLALTVQLRNEGRAQPSVGLDIYLSADTTLDRSDLKIATATTAVAAQAITNLAVTATVPSTLQEGSYRIIAVIDPGQRIAESDETNNIAVSSGSTSFVAADLDVGMVSADRAIAFRGQELVVTTELENRGGSQARGFDYEFYLSTNLLISRISDPSLGRRGPLTLGVGERQTLTHRFTVPSTVAIANYYVGVIVNANQRVTERLITNNTGRTMRTTTIRDPAPDYSVAQIRVRPQAAAGERLTIERALFNTGNAAGSTQYRVWLSTSGTINPARDVVILTASTTIAAGSVDLGTDIVRLAPTLAPGGYFVVYELDPQNNVDELDESNNVRSTTSPVTVFGVDLAILTARLPFATVGVPYGVVLGAQGGVGAYVWSVPRGRLPEGIALDPTSGTLSGSPRREELARFTVEVTDGLIARQREYSILVAEQTEAVEIVTRVLPQAFVGRTYEQPLVAFGGVQPYTWTVQGVLPAGVQLDGQGTLRGIPGQTDLRMFVARVADALGATAERVLLLRVRRPSESVRFSAEALPDGRLGDPYIAELGVESGSMPLTFDIIDGALPDGLQLTGAMIRGTPSRAGIYDFRVRVSDDAGEVDINRYIVEIGERNGVRFVTTSLPFAQPGAPYTTDNGSPIRLRAVTEQGSEGVRFSIVQGTLPRGLSLSERGVFTGTVASTGVADFVVRAEDSAGQRALRAFAIAVDQPDDPPPLPSPTDSGGCACVRDRHGPALGYLVLIGLLVLAARFATRGARVGPTVALLMFFAHLGGAKAQPVSYVVTTNNRAFVERTVGGMPLSFSNSNNGSASIPLPFAVQYHDAVYSTVTVSTNGYLQFGATTATDPSNDIIPSTINPDNLIAFWWDDLETSGERWFLEGREPNRRVIIQFTNAHRIANAAEGRGLVQVVLYEGRPRFDVHYGGVAGSTQPSSAWTFSAGYEDLNGATGRDFLACSPTCSRGRFPQDVVYRVQVDEGANIVARSISAPVSVFAGTPFSVGIQLDSVHANTLGPFTYAVYLLPVGQSTPSGTPLDSVTVSLQPFEELQRTLTVSLPASTSPGQYRFALVADTTGVLNEPNENDNLVFSAPVRVGAPRPDLAAIGVSAATMSVDPGGTLQVAFDVLNQGSLSANGDWGVFLSGNAAVTADDRSLGTGQVSVAPSARVSAQETLTVPADVSPGLYYLGVVLDPDDKLTEVSEVNNTAVASARLLISSSQLAISNASLPPFYLNVPYTAFLRATGGDGNYVWSVINGSLPMGVTLSAISGEIAGTPTSLGPSTATVQVVSSGASATRDYAIDVQPAISGLSIVTRQLLPAVIGQDYPPIEDGEEIQRLRTVGGTGVVSFSLDSPAPPGISLSSDGVFSGRPVQVGRFSVAVRARDGAGNEAERTLFLTVAEPGRLTLVADALPDAQLGLPYQTRLRFVGASRTATPTFSANTGGLPPGIVIASDGTVAGIPDAVGWFPFVVRVSEGAGLQSDTALFRIRVVAEDSLMFRVQGARTATVGEPIDVEVIAQGGTPPYRWRGGEDLPEGIEASIEGIEQNVYRIQGSLEEPGLATILATVTDVDERIYREPLTFRFVARPAIPPPPPTDGGGCRTRGGGDGLFTLGLGLLAVALLVRRARPRSVSGR